ncbi:Dynein heavy chain [Phytophthora megakarya]|uniref:Dynein heavy chain n=1 Tax=Phytophthora megakarya TaxID=4795 RepID=A0A225WXD2_9STRA|nr:Dynein heavy chain [Phytophthora megakarya]
MMPASITTDECWIVWKFLCDWVKTQVAMEVPASIPGFGTFYVRVQSLGIRITLFEPDQRFLSKYCIQVDSEMPDPAFAAILPSAMPQSEISLSTGGRNRATSPVGLGDLFAFSFVEMASCCGNSVDATRAQEWLNVVIHKLGIAMGQCDRVELNIGIGVILCLDRIIQRHLLPRGSRSTSRFEYEVRAGESVIKRNLRAQAAFQTIPKAKYSFLSGTTFASSIQLNPVLDRSKDAPDFSFGSPKPRPPVSSFAPIKLNARSSPRSKQLEKRYHGSASPLVSHISTLTTSPPIVTQGEDVDDKMSATPNQKVGNRFPQLFDQLSRTLCVEPDQNMSCLLPSNRIGSNFTETAAFLMTEKAASQFGYQTQVSDGLVFVESPENARIPQTRRQEVTQDSTSEQRYFDYLSDDKLIDRCYLAPLSANLEARVVSSAIKYIMGSSSDQIDNILEAAHKEFVENYYVSTKKAIINYLLMRATSRERLGIPHGVPVHALLPAKWKWGSSNGPNGCIGDLQTHSKSKQRKNVQSKVMSLLVLSNLQLRALRYMWHDLLTAVNLVDLPSAQDLSEAVDPIDIIEFERTQLAFSAKMKTFIMENWYNKAKMMFETAIRAETFSIHTSEAAVSFRLRHLFDTVAAVMSLQIRSLIMKSIQAYVNFFELFEEIKTENEESNSRLRVRDRPLFSGLLTTLVLRDGQIQFRDPLGDIPSRLLNVLHNIPKLFYNLGRIETLFDEPLLLPNTSSPFLWNVASQEDDIVVATIRIRSIIERNLMHLRKLKTDYDVYALTHRYVNSVDCFDLEENGELESYRAEMERVQATAMQLVIDNSHSQHLGLFSVDCHYVNKKLHSDLGQWTICLLQAFEQRTGRMNAELRQQYKEIAARLAKKPLDLYELVDSEAFVQSLKSSQLQELQEKGNIIKQRLRFLLFERENIHVGNIETESPFDSRTNVQDHENEILSTPVTGFRLSVDLLSSTAKTVKWRSHIEALLKEADALFVNERARIEAMFIAKRSRFQAEIEEFEGEVKGFAKKGDLRHAATYVVQLAKMQDNLYIFRQAMGTITKEEEKLQWKPTDFSKLDDIAEEMAPYEQLWKTVRDFREMNSRWLRGNVFELPGKEGLQTLQQMLTVVANVSSVLLLNSAAAAITAETVRKQITDFRENVRLIVAIQNPAIKERHMKAVSALIGIDFSSDEAITLLKVLEHGAFEIINDVVDISGNATQEQQIEVALNEVRDEWGATNYKLVPSKHPFSSGAVLAQFLMTDDLDFEVWNFVLDKTCSENIVSLMEDHLLRLQTLSCMDHAGPFIEDITIWQTFASDMGQVIETLTLIEQKWRKLIPFFAAGIIDTDSKESELFANAAHLYRSVHTAILFQPACKAYFLRTNTSENSETAGILPAVALISDLNQCLELLETVKEGVRTGFETKRSSLARFYFLSDAELVTALAFASVPSDPTLWKALSRCFPGIHGVQTNGANEITALLSSTGEPFPLGSPIITADTSMPMWLAKVESSMTTILHASIRAACSDMARKEFRKWCLIWPEQSLLAAIHCVWTIESEQAYQHPNRRKAWTAITNDLNENLEAVNKEIRVATYPHSKATLGNVMLLLTQLRDVSSSILGEVGGIWSEECLESHGICRRDQQAMLSHYPPSLTWVAQPRFYFIDSVLSVTVMTSSYIPYGLEYLGNGAPGLLVTPLTLRCYHAIAQAASTIIKGVCLKGAAGTGKTTICHQFARLCGRLGVMFQCANRKLSMDDLANFIKATASSGAWLCMDNLQLLDATSVSIATMLCSQVMTSLAARHSQCTLVGDKVRLRRGALFLLTLTTRHHLNSSARSSTNHSIQSARFFFRTIVVQSPDLEKLAEFELHRGRFVHASNLAKLVTVALTAFERGFELLKVPAEIVDEMEVLGERLVNLRQIKRIVKRATELNCLEKEDRRRTRNSTLTIPEVDANVSATGDATSNDEAAEVIAKNDNEQMEYRNVNVAIREHICCVVPSANLHLVDAIIEAALLAPTRFAVVCPRALRCGQLLDLAVDHQSHSVFAKLLKEAKTIFRADKGTHTWFVFDGDLDSSWCEQLLYTVEDLQDDIPGHKKGLQLLSGKYLTVPEYVRIIMETTTLTNASPSFISRVGALHVSRSNDGKGWEKLYEVWKKLRKLDFKEYAEVIFATLDVIVSETVADCVNFTRTNFQSYRNASHGVERVQWMLALFHSALKQSWKKHCLLRNDKQRSTIVSCIFLQALVWGVGSTTDTFERQKFHLFLYGLLFRGPNNEESTLKRLVAPSFPSGTLIEANASVGDKTNAVATANSNTSASSEAKRTVYVFVDDVHCFDLHQRMDSAAELLRMLAEYQSVVDPTTNIPTLCPNFLPFVTLQTPLPDPLHTPTQSHDIERLVRRFVPIPLLPLSDSDLSSICESFPVSMLTSNESREPLTGSIPSQRAATTMKEAEQLQSIIIKASLKLFRLLTSRNEFTIVQKDATINPTKVHYNFRVGKLFLIVKTICCEIRPTLAFAEKPVLARLWCHESDRVLGDSFVEQKELFAFHRRVIDIALTSFGVDDNTFFPARLDAVALQNPTITQNWFGNDLHFSFIADGSTSGIYRNGYHEINEMKNVELVIERSMKAMHHTNANAPKNPEALNLVLCSHVVKNVLKISRLLRMNKKAMLMLSARGRKLVTITRLACFMCKKALTVYHIPASDASKRSLGLNGICNRNEAGHNRKWNEALRAALLKSVRTRDTAVVFIVKDVYLDSESYIHRDIDQYLAGYNLPSDVITYEDLDEDVLSILRESAKKERNQPQGSHGGNHNPVATHFQTSSVLRSKSTTLSYFFQLARQNLQLVLIFSPPPTSSVDTRGANLGSIFWRFPHILKSCDVTYTSGWTTEALITVAQRCLAHTSIASDKQSCTQVAEAAVRIYNIMDPNSNKRHPSMLVDHIALFASHYDHLENTIPLNLARYKAGLEFIDRTSKILETEQAQAELLLPEVIQKTDRRRRMSANLEKEKLTADKLTRGLDLALTLEATQRERLATVTREYQDLIQDSRQMFDQMKGSLLTYHAALDCKDVDQIDNHDDNPGNVKHIDTDMVTRRRLRQQVRKFVSLKRIPSSIYQLSECLGVILGIESVEGRDEMDPDEIIKNYWKNVAVEIDTTNFWKTLTTFDVPKNITTQMVSTLLPICTSPDFDKDLFASVHIIAGVLCEWVQKCITFAQDFILAEPKYAQLQRERDLLKEAEAQVVKRKVEIFEQSTSSRHTNEERDVSEMERQKVDEKLQGTNSLLHLTTSAWKVLSSTREKWQQKTAFYSEFAEHWKGDLLLATATATYASHLTQSPRLHLYQLWKEALTIPFLTPSSPRRPLHEVFSINEVELTKMNLNGLPANDDSATENAVIALHSYHSPLLIDPFGVATDWLMRHFSSQKLVVSPANNSTTDAAVWREIEMSIKGETTLILTDICKERMDGLRSFVGAKRRALFDAVNHEVSGINRSSGGYRCWCYPPEDITNSCSLDTTFMKPNTNSPRAEHHIFEFGSDACKVFFIYTDKNDLPEWLSEYSSQLTVIQFEMTAPCVEAQGLQKLLESQGRLRELTEIRTLQNDTLICDEQIYGLEDELLEFFSTENAEQVYSDNSKALRIVANRNFVQTLESTKADATTKIHRHWASMASYVGVAKRCLDAVWAWHDFSSVIQKHGMSEKTFTLSWIWRLLVRAGETSSKAENNIELMACFTSYLEQNVVMNLRDEDRLLFRFCLAFRIWQRRLLALMSKTDQNGDDRCRPTLKNLLSVRPTGMKSITWSAVCYLAEASGELRQFISKMKSLENGQITWKALLEIGTLREDDWDAAAPLDVFTRMCVVVAIHPYRFLCEVENFSWRVLRRMHTLPSSSTLPAEANTPALPTLIAAAAHTATAQYPDTHRDLFYMWRCFSSSSTPLIVFCPQSIDFVDAVANVAKRAGATMDITDTIQLQLADEATFKSMMLLAMEKGQWIVLPNVQSSPERLNQLSDIYESLKDGRSHLDFRLWISIANQSPGNPSIRHLNFDAMRIARIATQREWGSGFISLKRSLHHTFATLKVELESFTFKYPAPSAADTVELSEYEEQCLRQLGVFHALLSSRDHFPFAEWKYEGEFGDGELCTAIRSLMALRTEENTATKEHPVGDRKIGIWTEINLRGVISYVYTAKLESLQDRLLVNACANLVLSAWPPTASEEKLHSTTTVAQLTIPEAVFAIGKLAVVPWVSIVSAIPQLWISESCGPPLSNDKIVTDLPHTDGISLWDPHNLRKERRRKFASQLAVMATNRGCQIPTNFVPPVASPHMYVLPLLETIASFRKNLEGIVLQHQNDEFEYGKPIQALVNHERQTLQHIQKMILNDIGRLEAVSFQSVSIQRKVLMFFRTCTDKHTRPATRFDYFAIVLRLESKPGSILLDITSPPSNH